MNVSTTIIALLVLALCCLGALYQCERDQRVAAEKELSVAIEANEANTKAIQLLNEAQQTNDKAISTLLKDKEDIDHLRRSLNSSIQKLIINNEDFQKWASTRIPDDAVRMFNETSDDSSASSGGN